MCRYFGFSVNGTLIPARKLPPFSVPQPITLANNAIRIYGKEIKFPQSVHPGHDSQVTLTNKPYRICRKYTALLESKSTSGSISDLDRQWIQEKEKNDVTGPYRSLLAGDA